MTARERGPDSTRARTKEKERDEAMRRIEHFIAQFVRNAQSRSPRSMTLGAPRSRMRGASVQWPFPARHADRVRHWGT